jgi:hypothetical protein
MRPNKNLDIAAAITELGVGEALVSMLSENGTPEITERCYIGCPGSQIGPITPEERKALMRTSIVAGVYDQAVDRESAYEILQAGGGAAPAGKTGAAAQGGAASPQESGEPSAMDSVVSGIKDILFGSTGPRGGHRQGVIESMARSAVRQAGTKIIRGVLGSILGGKR